MKTSIFSFIPRSPKQLAMVIVGIFAALYLLFTILPTGIGTYSSGLRMGEFTKLSSTGVLNRTGEGQLNMGKEGSPYIITEEYTDKDGEVHKSKTVVNPWYMSTSKDDVAKYEAMEGKYVWIAYRQYIWHNPLKGDTDYQILDVQEVTREYPVVSQCEVAQPSSWKSDGGSRIGRLVKDSDKGNVIKTGEAIIQMGESGNQYKFMSIPKEMQPCADAYLKSGKSVMIHYTEKLIRNPLTQDTNYTIWKISPKELDGL